MTTRIIYLFVTAILLNLSLHNNHRKQGPHSFIPGPDDLRQVYGRERIHYDINSVNPMASVNTIITKGLTFMPGLFNTGSLTIS